ncbi:hypothetical protein [Dysosmobacter sp.]|uniref:hypothetical protein n=1 Tax=Dysosmobacter sp. TaxID=2591382 RepID=UPI00307D5AC6
MAEFDDKLNSLLSNPEAMDQIMKMAQSLMGNGGGTEQPPPAAPPSGKTGNAVQNGGGPFQQSGPVSGETAQSWGQPSPESRNPSPSGPVVNGQPGSGPGFFSGLGDLDPKAIASLLPVLRELGEAQNSNARQLLFALRPYLKPERQDKVERALQLARLFRVEKKFLLRGDGHV